MVFFLFQQFPMPGDPSVLEGVPVPTALITPDLLHTVAVKLPPFWPDNIETWFVQSESQFCLKKVSVKFDYCIYPMTQEVAMKVLNLNRNPSTDDPYQHLKNRLLSMFALNDYAHAEAIANLTLTGNMQPSALMSRMLRLLPYGHAPCFLL